MLHRGRLCPPGVPLGTLAEFFADALPAIRGSSTASSSMRPGPRPTWSAHMVGDREDSACANKRRTGIGKRSHSLRPCRSTAKASKPISKPIYRAVPRADAQARHHGQSRQPQGLCGAPGHSSPRGFCSCRATVPDLNPIEHVFAKLKTLLRNAAEPTVEATWQRIGAPLDCFTPQECANLHPKRRICCHPNGKCF